MLNEPRYSYSITATQRISLAWLFHFHIQYLLQHKEWSNSVQKILLFEIVEEIKAEVCNIIKKEVEIKVN